LEPDDQHESGTPPSPGMAGGEQAPHLETRPAMWAFPETRGAPMSVPPSKTDADADRSGVPHTSSIRTSRHGYGLNLNGDGQNLVRARVEKRCPDGFGSWPYTMKVGGPCIRSPVVQFGLWHPRIVLD